MIINNNNHHYNNNNNNKNTSLTSLINELIKPLSLSPSLCAHVLSEWAEPSIVSERVPCGAVAAVPGANGVFTQSFSFFLSLYLMLYS